MKTYYHKYTTDVRVRCEPDKYTSQELDKISKAGIYTLIAEYRCPCCAQWARCRGISGIVGDENINDDIAMLLEIAFEQLQNSLLRLEV